MALVRMVDYLLTIKLWFIRGYYSTLRIYCLGTVSTTDKCHSWQRSVGRCPGPGHGRKAGSAREIFAVPRLLIENHLVTVKTYRPFVAVETEVSTTINWHQLCKAVSLLQEGSFPSFLVRKWMTSVIS